ncbi:MAG: heparan-alpha-glucosaminide N-acetyltransferase [Methanoregula sp.]|nr:heparan-alpha-glucosaminide N-acetyltransferase [Methanoregula sp.]
MQAASRLWEIDAARGIAILMMIVFHTVFDLSFFAICPVNVASGFWRYFAYATATLFLLIAGISLVVSHARASARLSGFSLAEKFILRGAGIFALGLLVTVATWFYLHEGYVIFGILHLIGVSIILSPLFFRFGKLNVLLGLVCIPAGFLISHVSGPAFLIPLGIMPAGFTSVDYTPLLPWFGVVLVGLGLGEFLYAGGVRQFSLKPLSDYIVTPLSFLGRHSLVIYLVHQPVIILLLAAVTGTKVL